MLLELLKNYADMINSATRMTQRSATEMARTMLIQAGMEPAADMVSKLSEQMIAAQEAQYAMMRRMIQAEVDMTVARMGVLPVGRRPVEEETAEADHGQDEPVAELKVIAEPEAEETGGEAPGTTQATTGAKTESAEPEVAKLQPVRGARESAPADDDAANPAPAAKKAPAKRAAPRKTTARKTTTPRKSAATKSTAKKASAKSAAAKTVSTSTAKTAAKAPSKRTSTKADAEGGATGGTEAGS